MTTGLNREKLGTIFNPHYSPHHYNHYLFFYINILFVVCLDNLRILA